ncbi:merozoite surface protein 3 [Plasmodium gonderi]|uniref:MSP3-like protein n=1 Tax=Plasmodium gonderi TaxID=77519 RepID=X2CMP5_PLAGO|nr:merozoite surface protein 3 [Plasmodium gonderi]AGR50725.1 MSP3-like protein [Plasmodium gonderi]GAW81525.1 merozoite surface protein 3 [Plasmodium gonderi]
MKQIWSTIFFIFFLNIFALEYNVVNNEIINLRNSGARNNVTSDNKSASSSSIASASANDENQIQKLAEEAELLSMETKMLVELASQAVEQVKRYFIKNTQIIDADLSEMESGFAKEDTIRASKDAAAAAERARVATTVAEAMEAKEDAERAKYLAERSAGIAKEEAKTALTLSGKTNEVSELEKIKIPIPDNEKPKTAVVKRPIIPKQPSSITKQVEVKESPAPPQKSAVTTQDNVKTKVTPAASEPAKANKPTENKSATDVKNQDSKNKTELLHEEKNITSDLYNTKSNQEKKDEPVSQSESTQGNIFYRVGKGILNKIKAFFSFFKYLLF